MSTPDEQSKKWSLIVDVEGCTNCNLCVLACKDEHVGNSFPGYADEMPKHGHNWIRIETRERGAGPMIDVSYLPVMCQHCDDAPCIRAAEEGAVTKRQDGIVIIDPDKARGQRHLVDSCPYGAIWWNEEKQVPQHWIFDAHLLDTGWTEPRAATVCATAAIRSIKSSDDELKNLVSKEGLETLHPEYGTKPRVWYKNLFLFDRCFIGGSVEIERDGVIDCLAGALVKLGKGGDLLAESRTDSYGDFKFDGLNENSGNYTITIIADEFDEIEITAELGASLYLGEIRMSGKSR